MDSLEIKRKSIEYFTESGLYPYTKFYLRNIKKHFGDYWKNHFSTIGLVGMNEAIENYLGTNIGSPEGCEFAGEVLDFMRNLLTAFQKKTGNNYNLEATPAEGTSYRLALIDQAKLQDIIFANGRGQQVKHPFYTNSTHLPVNYSDDIFEVLELQDNLQEKYTGGTVLHFFLGERINDTESLKNLIKHICTYYHLPYFTFSPTFSICWEHGYIPGEHQQCPQCGKPCEVYARIVGYLRPISQWNDGKKAEFTIREKYKIAAQA
jgi:ribonucleoside-triphosphate reductase